MGNTASKVEEIERIRRAAAMDQLQEYTLLHCTAVLARRSLLAQWLLRSRPDYKDYDLMKAQYDECDAFIKKTLGL